MYCNLNAEEKFCTYDLHSFAILFSKDVNMSLKFRLIVLYFLQFFVWGAWLISLGGYMNKTLGFSGFQIGSVYATMGISSLFMPALLGIVADKWVQSERLLGFCHILGASFLILAAFVTDSSVFYIVILLHSLMYMPTISLSNSVSFNALEKEGFDVMMVFPKIRVWGTVGFVVAMWVVDLSGWTLSNIQLLIAAVVATVLGFYSFSLPECGIVKKEKSSSWVSMLGLDAFKLFKRKSMAIFFLFSMLLGAALQVTNAFGEVFLHDFDTLFPDSFAVKYPGILMSISQISETLFILTIPFFLRKFGIKIVMLLSMFAWVLRFALFGIGNPDGGFFYLVLSMIVYGMAFDFFNISGSLFVETETNEKHRASAQGLFMLMTNGVGAIIGGQASGWVVDFFTQDGVKNWPQIWFSFAAYVLVIGLAFTFMFSGEKQGQKAQSVLLAAFIAVAVFMLHLNGWVINLHV